MTDLQAYGVGLEIALMALVPLSYWLWLKHRKGKYDGR